VGPLNFRVASYQIATAGPVRVSSTKVEVHPTSLRGEGSRVTVLTLNGFNLDAHKEDPRQVNDPRRDVDDDVADGRFLALGQAIVRDAACPAIVALQEIQDNDGAELSDKVRAERTYAGLIAAVQRAGGPTYAWVDIPPRRGADGGQPGGNIRNAFLYDPGRVQLVAGSLQRLGSQSPAFEGSRKPLAARFRLVEGQGELELINVHLASKRHQNGLFAPQEPGLDPRLAVRVQQAEVIGAHLAQLRAQQVDYYVTGDFNDFEFSQTLRALTEDHSANLVDGVPEPLRFDYNHRGLSQALMHGVVAKRQLVGRTVEYEILHTNALQGSQPGRRGDKASDHAYAIARLELA
jgi:predicted extracellular nuclease